MRIFIIDTYYSAFLDRFYEKNQALTDASFDETSRALLSQCFGTGDFYSRNLKALGHEATEVIYNDLTLQKKWATEHNIPTRFEWTRSIPKLRSWISPKWPDTVLIEQIKAFKPDVIYCQSLTSPEPDLVRSLKKHAKLVVGQVASPLEFDKEKLPFDLILTSFPHFVEKFRSIGISSEYFKIGFEPTILEKIGNQPKSYGAVFVGGFSKHHQEIIETFEYATSQAPIDFWGYGVKKLSQDSPIRARHHGEAWALDMYKILANSKISINRHIGVAENFANNMRLYESTGVGTMLLTDMKDNLSELFEIGREIETYASKEELADKIKYYLAHEREREKIAMAGQARTLKDHTYRMRMQELSVMLAKYLP